MAKTNPVKSANPDYITRQSALEDMNKTAQVIREDFIVIFGIFASVLIFLGVEIQVFKAATRFSYLVGFSSFLLGALLSFILAIMAILRGQTSYKDFKNNVIAHFILACFIASGVCFFYASFLRPIIK